MRSKVLGVLKKASGEIQLEICAYKVMAYL